MLSPGGSSVPQSCGPSYEGPRTSKRSKCYMGTVGGLRTSQVGVVGFTSVLHMAEPAVLALGSCPPLHLACCIAFRNNVLSNPET